MEERYGVRGTVQDDVFFTEDAISRAATVRHLHVEISRQNANLTEVKRALAIEVRGCGGNALANFRYGQRARKWWSFGWDTESWHGEGDAVRA